MVENAIAQILEQIYEPKFYDESYGFGPNRNCHKAVKKVVETVGYQKTNYVVEANIRGFFDNVNYEWLMKMLVHDIADRKFLGIIEKFLKAGIMEDRKRRGEGKPETFDFLGFTFYCGTDAKKRFFRCKVKTSRKKLRSKTKAMKEWIKSHRDMPLEWIFRMVNAKLRGHYQYYGVTDNMEEMCLYLHNTKMLLFKWLNRRSQRRSYTWEAFTKGLLRTFPLIRPQIRVSLLGR